MIFRRLRQVTGAMVSGPAAGNTLWSGFGGGCQTNNDGDPIVQYDKPANRWILTQFSVSTTPYLQCVAVSTTSDATGTYNRYAFSYSNFPDYPKLGVWPDGYYISYNIFQGNFFAGRRCAPTIAPQCWPAAAATQQCFQLSTSFGGLLPSDLDGTTAPARRLAELRAELRHQSLNLWKFHVDWPTGQHHLHRADQHSGGGLQRGLQRRNLHPAARHQPEARLARRPPDVPPGVPELCRSRSARGQPLGRQLPAASAGTSCATRRARRPCSSRALSRPIPTTAGWAASPWTAGNIALGYSVSSGPINPGIRFTGRVPTDPLGTMQAENTIINGGGSQLTNLSRWGDYSA